MSPDETWDCESWAGGGQWVTKDPLDLEWLTDEQKQRIYLLELDHLLTLLRQQATMLEAIRVIVAEPLPTS